MDDENKVIDTENFEKIKNSFVVCRYNRIQRKLIEVRKLGVNGNLKLFECRLIFGKN